MNAALALKTAEVIKNVVNLPKALFFVASGKHAGRDVWKPFFRE